MNDKPMNENSSHSNQEDLAKKLLESSPENWPGELKALRIEKRTMPAALRAKLDGLNESVQNEEPRNEEPRNEESQSKNPREFESTQNLLPFIRRPIFAVTSIGGSIAAAILLYLGFFATSNELAPVEVTFISGVVTHNNTGLTIGAHLEPLNEFKSGANSVAVVATHIENQSSQLRILSNTDGYLRTLTNQLFETRLNKGTILSQLNRQADGGNVSRRLSVTTSTSESLVIGTVFSIESTEDKETKLSTYEGTVSFRRRWDALEDLPEILFEKNPFLEEVRGVFKNATARVPAGSESIVNDQDFQSRVAQVQALNNVLENPQVKVLRNRKDVSESEIKAALKVIQDAFPTELEKKEIVGNSKVAFGKAPEVTKANPDELDAKRAILEETTDAERQTLYEKWRKDNQSASRESFEKEATRILGKAPQEIILTNGEQIYGSVFGENGKYKIFTSTGIRIIEPEEIEEIKFE